MLISLGSDALVIREGSGKKCHIIAQKEIIEVAPKILKHLAKKKKCNAVYVLTGPGSFTTLRVGSLILNTLKTIKAVNRDFFCCNKIVFFKTLVEQRFLPPKGIVRIGQKRNVGICDFHNDDFIVVPKEKVANLENVRSESEKNASVRKSPLRKQEQNHTPSSFFVEELYEEEVEKKRKKNVVSLSSYDEKTVGFSYQRKQKQVPLDLFRWKKSDFVIPEYVLEPNIG